MRIKYIQINKSVKFALLLLPSLGRVGGGLLLLLSLGLQAQSVKITAAADLRYAMDEIALLYMNLNPGTSIDVVYGSSGNAYTQLANGAPFDIFFSADIMYPKKLYEAGLTSTSPRLYAIGRLVLWSSTLDVEKGSVVLKTPRARIAIANPLHAPYGVRAVEALNHYGLYQQVSKQLVFGENISHAAQFCLTGNTDVGILALSLVLSPTMTSRGQYFIIPDKAHSPLEQAYVIMNRAKDNQLAFGFCEFIETKAAREIFEKYGFELPLE